MSFNHQPTNVNSNHHPTHTITTTRILSAWNHMLLTHSESQAAAVTVVALQLSALSLLPAYHLHFLSSDTSRMLMRHHHRYHRHRH
jgi:hypothetical protein